MMDMKSDSSMMKMNMMCMQMMMQGDIMDQKGMMDKDDKGSGNGNHEQHHK